MNNDLMTKPLKNCFRSLAARRGIRHAAEVMRSLGFSKTMARRVLLGVR